MVLTGTASPIIFERRRAISALGILMRSSLPTLRQSGRQRIQEAVPTIADGASGHLSDVEREITYEVLSCLLEVGDSIGTEQAEVLVVPPNCPQNVRSRLIVGLVAREIPRSIEVILGLLEGMPGRHEDLVAFLSGLQPQLHLAVSAATQLLSNRSIVTAARVEIGRALLECGPAGVEGVQSVADDRTMSWSVRSQLYAELLRAAVPNSAETAARLLSNPNLQSEDRVALTLALIEDGVTEAIPDAAMLLSTRHVEWPSRQKLARALARQGEAGRNLLAAQIYHGGIDLGLTLRHICALIEVGDPRGHKEALRLHSDRGVPIGSSCAR